MIDGNNDAPPTRSPHRTAQFTFGPQSPQNFSFHPFEIEKSVPAESPRKSSSSHSHRLFNSYGVTYSYHNPGQEIRKILERLDRGYFLIFKYFVGILAVIEIIGSIFNIVDFFTSMQQQELFRFIAGTVLLVWNAYQLCLEYKAIDSKEYSCAKKAVMLMKWYMVVLGILFFFGAGVFFLMDTSEWAPQISEMSFERYLLAICLTIAVVEGAFYLLCLHGALKVQNLLGQLDDMMGGNYSDNVA